MPLKTQLSDKTNMECSWFFSLFSWLERLYDGVGCKMCSPFLWKGEIVFHRYCTHYLTHLSYFELHIGFDKLEQDSPSHLLPIQIKLRIKIQFFVFKKSSIIFSWHYSLLRVQLPMTTPHRCTGTIQLGGWAAPQFHRLSFLYCPNFWAFCPNNFETGGPPRPPGSYAYATPWVLYTKFGINESIDWQRSSKYEK